MIALPVALAGGGSGGGGVFGTLAILAIAPSVFWMWWFYRKDRYDPEPRGLIVKIFLLGMLPVLPAGILEVLLTKVLFGANSESLAATATGMMLVVGPVEEYGKYLVVRRWAFRNPAFDEPLDGIIYAAAAALGFAAFENFLYLLDNGALLILVRGPLSTLAHVLFSALWGYALGMAWAQTDPVAAKRTINNGLLAAMLGHGAFDVVLVGSQLIGLFALLLAIVLVIVLYRRVGAHIRTSLANSPFQVTLPRPERPGREGS